LSPFMPIDISVRFSFTLDNPCDALLQFEAAAIPEQLILSSDTRLPVAEHVARVPAQDSIGERVWLRTQGRCEVEYRASVAVRRIAADIASLPSLQPHALPGEAVQYLFDSRYCPADRLQSFVEEEFVQLTGGARIAAMSRWIGDHFTYDPVSTSDTTAIDSFVERRGVCRDYAHVLIAFARASAIPARYISAYAPGVNPPDFHALAEVFLADPSIPGGGAWHMVDATGMADPTQTVKIGVGRDAADVSFMTTFGWAHFEEKVIAVSQSR
jgi:transglutaminase-like putative cysteine protease